MPLPLPTADGPACLRRWRRARSRVSPLVTCLAACGCLVVLGIHEFSGGWVCNIDTAYCATSGQKDGLYTGVLRDPDGRVLASTPFTVAFASRSVAGDTVGGFRTDQTGRYCIRWAGERVTPFLYVNGRFAGGARNGWQPLHGASPPRGCQSGNRGIPWDRTDALKSTPEFRSVVIGGLASIGLLALGLLLGRIGEGREIRLAGLALHRAGLVLSAVSTGLFFFVWYVLPPLQ